MRSGRSTGHGSSLTVSQTLAVAVTPLPRPQPSARRPRFALARSFYLPPASSRQVIPGRVGHHQGDAEAAAGAARHALRDLVAARLDRQVAHPFHTGLWCTTRHTVYPIGGRRTNANSRTPPLRTTRCASPPTSRRNMTTRLSARARARSPGGAT